MALRKAKPAKMKFTALHEDFGRHAIPAKQKAQLISQAFVLFWLERQVKNACGGRCKFRTCDPCSVNAVLYP